MTVHDHVLDTKTNTPNKSAKGSHLCVPQNKMAKGSHLRVPQIKLAKGSHLCVPQNKYPKTSMWRVLTCVMCWLMCVQCCFSGACMCGGGGAA